MPTILGANTLSSGYDVANSLRFNDDSSDYLNRTPGSAGNRRTFTISCWIKRGQTTTLSNIMSAWASNADSGHFLLRFDSAERLDVSTWSTNLLTTTAVFRDPSAWYHVVCAIDTTSGTADNRVRLYVNGVEQSNYSTRNNPSQNADLQVNNDSIQVIGANYYTSSAQTFSDGYLAEFVLIDGQALDPTSFGEFDEDSPTIWKPIDVSGLTFGTNGFYLDFEDSGSLGNDKAGSNNFTVNNLTAIDQSTDTCTNNFATFNPIAKSSSASSATFAEGNLDMITGAGAWKTAPSTIGLTQGKWYYEVKSGTINAANAYIQAGVSSEQSLATNIGSYHQSTTYSYAYHWDGSKYVNNSATASWGSAITTGDIVMIAADFDNNYIYAGLNGTWQNSGDPTSGSSGTGALSSLQSGQLWFLTVSGYNNTHKVNFGSGPSFSISSGNSDANGYGNFEYAVPSGYYSLNTKNLAEFG